MQEARPLVETLSWRGLEYRRWTDREGSIPRGTIELDGRRIYGYPSIARILGLEAGIAEHFSGPFWMEEKVDGYNVRILRHGERLLAFTRGGFLCPFTTGRLPELIPADIFDAHPDLVVCAEAAGPETPYCEASPPFVDSDLRLYVFDMMRAGSSEFLSRDRMYALADRFGLPTVERLGRFEPGDLARIGEIMDRLNAEGREGAVFKDERGKRVKYTTARANIEDIAVTAEGLADMPPPFFISRVLRLGLYAHERHLDTDRLAAELGAAFLDGLKTALDQAAREHRVYHRYSCRCADRQSAEDLFAHLQRTAGHQVGLRLHRLEREGRYWRLEFDREPKSMNGLLIHLLRGGSLYD